MLNSWQEARNFKGRTYGAIGREVEVTDKTVMRWAKGSTSCPIHKRASVDRVMGVPVDWAAYDAECCKQVPLSPAAANPAPQVRKGPQEAPKPPPAPQKAPTPPPAAELSAEEREFNELYGVIS